MEPNRKSLSENTPSPMPTGPEVPSTEPCAYINPRLWLYFCKRTGRDAMPSEVWSEADVVQFLETCVNELEVRS